MQLQTEPGTETVKQLAEDAHRLSDDLAAVTTENIEGEEKIGSPNYWSKRNQRKATLFQLYDTCGKALKLETNNAQKVGHSGAFTESLSPVDALEILNSAGFLEFQNAEERLRATRQQGARSAHESRLIAIETASGVLEGLLQLGSMEGGVIANPADIKRRVANFYKAATMMEKEMTEEEAIFLILSLGILPEDEKDSLAKPQTRVIARNELDTLLQLLAIIDGNEEIGTLLHGESDTWRQFAIADTAGKTANRILQIFGPAKPYTTDTGSDGRNGKETVGDVISEAIAKALQSPIGQEDLQVRTLGPKPIFRPAVDTN
ncbi:hypothetical protein H6802_02190 [Candidatus Nomurabacteria bacterium]|nr:hypothetical protein [Candidatus Nomurabacteria bacterium]MCB9827179.1 hypothetical protein [Candidatus Nomurabacteria bacterium]MCB9827537.1 hypothetical protein [Candidatus Nomurabacteria bacterium]